jgi:hypothetical protein
VRQLADKFKIRRERFVMPLEGSDSIAECGHVTRSGVVIMFILRMNIEGKRVAKHFNGGAQRPDSTCE